MIGLPAGTRIWIAAGVTNLRRGFTGLSGMVQTALQKNPFSGHVFVFRGRRGDLIKMWLSYPLIQKYMPYMPSYLMPL